MIWSQFHYGSITTFWLSFAGACFLDMSQFHYGSITTFFKLPDHPRAWGRLNSTMVRLQLQRLCEKQGITDNSLNSTMVRLQQLFVEYNLVTRVNRLNSTMVRLQLSKIV